MKDSNGEKYLIDGFCFNTVFCGEFRWYVYRVRLLRQENAYALLWLSPRTKGCIMVYLFFSLILVLLPMTAQAYQTSVADYASVQDAIDAHPGEVLFVPAGKYEIDEALRLTEDNSGLVGYGAIIQRNKNAAILEISGARGVRIRDLTLTRAEDGRDCNASGIAIRDCRDTLIANIRLIDNRSQRPAIEVRTSVDCRITGVEIRNYKRIAIDDRTAAGESLHGYAFNCIDGTGIMVRHSQNISLLNNRIVEEHLLPTKEIQERHRLGSLTDGRYPTNLGVLGKMAVVNEAVSNWHQGSAIVVTSPETTRDVIIHGNYIENSAQGIDLHCDYVRCADNTVIRGMMGIKMTHGTKHVVVANNLLTQIDLWGILYNPGEASHDGLPATDDAPARSENVDGGSVIANNIIADYGYGHEYWNWGGASDDQAGAYAIAFFEGQLPENPPVSHVLVTGNLVYHAHDLTGDKPPRYRYALYLGPWDSNKQDSPNLPQNIKIHGNMSHPGTRGISNVDIPE